jgi:pimeloyl-ACP methyl ester carboxylesterase
VLTHGWPSSFYELLPLVPLLTDPASHGGDPADAFDVVIPSLPGYGFSDPLPGRGSSARIPELWMRLMTEVLGYRRFGAHGGDIGAYVTNRLGYEFPEQVVGIHVTMVAEADLGPGAASPSAAERAFLAGRVAGRRPWPTGWPTHRWGWPPGSSTSGGSGATATATPNAGSARTSSSRP